MKLIDNIAFYSNDTFLIMQIINQYGSLEEWCLEFDVPLQTVRDMMKGNECISPQMLDLFVSTLGLGPRNKTKVVRFIERQNKRRELNRIVDMLKGLSEHEAKEVINGFVY